LHHSRASVPKIYIIQDHSLNAFATGRDAEHAVVCLTTGIVEKLEKTELEGVIAHELSHIGNKDILLSTVIVVLVGFVAILAGFFRRWSFFGGGRRDNRGWRAIGYDSIYCGSCLIYSCSYRGNAYSTGNIAQTRISRGRGWSSPHEISGRTGPRTRKKFPPTQRRCSMPIKPQPTFSLIIPSKGKKFSNLFQTHPPIAERVKRLRGMDV